MRAPRCCARACGARNDLLLGFTARLKPCPDTCMVCGCDMAVQAVYARSASLRAGLRRKENLLFCAFTARLKPCPDTCMVCGCDMAVQAVYARSASLRAGLRRKENLLFCAFTARLKPCPDTCMVDGCNMAVQAILVECRWCRTHPSQKARMMGHARRCEVRG
jgi:hypothetical protein